MLPVSRLRFRVDLVQLLLLLVVSALIDLGIDWVRFGADGYFTWFGLGNEIFGAGVLLLSAAILAIAFGQREFVLRVAGAGVGGLSAAAGRAYRAVRDAASQSGTIFCWSAFDVSMIVWAFALSVRCVALSLAPPRPGRWRRALVGGLVLIAPDLVCVVDRAERCVVEGAVRRRRRSALPESGVRTGAGRAAASARRGVIRPRGRAAERHGSLFRRLRRRCARRTSFARTCRPRSA